MESIWFVYSQREGKTVKYKRLKTTDIGYQWFSNSDSKWNIYEPMNYLYTTVCQNTCKGKFTVRRHLPLVGSLESSLRTTRLNQCIGGGVVYVLKQHMAMGRRGGSGDFCRGHVTYLHIMTAYPTGVA